MKVTAGTGRYIKGVVQMLGNVYGLDLGTYEIKIFDKKKDRIWPEKNAIAMKNKQRDKKEKING